jgi:large subunit ribosomal protein L18
MPLRIRGIKRRHRRIRKRVSGTAQRPRLCVFRSAKHLYAQLINDEAGKTIVSASTLDATLRKANISGGTKQSAEQLGQLIAQKAQTHKITSIVFDRGGYQYHGRVQALADAARANGLEF